MSFLLLCCLLSGGCAYKIGTGLTRGVLNEAGGEGKSDGIQGPMQDVAERALLMELGTQLGEGLKSGVTELTPEETARLERTIDGLLQVAGARTGNSLRTQVSPELRGMITRDIIGAFADGLRGDLGDSLDETIDGVVSTAIGSLKANLSDPETKNVFADAIRESVYFAMRDQRTAIPSVGETIQLTLQENMLAPVEGTVDKVTDVVATRLDASARKTERTLQGIIGGLVIVMSVMVLMYFIMNRQKRRLEEQNISSERGRRNLDVALKQLDEETRKQILARAAELLHDTDEIVPPPR